MLNDMETHATRVQEFEKIKWGKDNQEPHHYQKN